MLKIAVIDGQGGGIGKHLIEALKKESNWDVEIIALGTNTLATETMLKAGADMGATGENAIIYNSRRVDFILGPMGIVAANAINGEITPAIAHSVADSQAPKLLIPLGKCNIEIAGVDRNLTLPQIVEKAVGMVRILHDSTQKSE